MVEVDQVSDSELIARLLEGAFRCYDCRSWLPLAQAARDIRYDEETVAGVQCDDCAADFEADHVEVA